MNILAPIPENLEDLHRQIDHLAEALEERLEHAKSFKDVDIRALHIARTELQTGFMWLRRGLNNTNEF